MALTLSCDTLFFTKAGLDNIVTLQWSGVDSAPCSTAVFKVKCSSPQLFHVVPCYGAMLLVDERGDRPSGYKGGSITIAMSSRKEEAASPATERFSIEYYILKEEPFTYQRINSSLSNPQQQAQAAKAAWSLITSDTLLKSHVSPKSSLSIRVKIEGEEALDIPSNARLVPHTSHSSPRTARADTSDGGGENAAGGAEAIMQGLKEAARTMKQEINTEIRAAREEEKRARQKEREAATAAATAAAATATSNAANRGVVMAVCPEPDLSRDVIMRFSGAPTPGSGKGGLGLFTLTVLMIIAFWSGIFLRDVRGG